MCKIKKIEVLCLSLLVSLFPILPLAPPAYASTPDPLLQSQPDGSLIPVVPVTEDTLSQTTVDGNPESELVELFPDDSPLSSPDEVEVASNDPYYGTSGMWWHPRVEAEKAWQFTRGAGVTIAVIDTGVDFYHPDLAANIWTNPNEVPGNGVDDDGNGLVDDIHGWDYVNGDNDPQDDNGHGSHVSGIAAALADNGIGIAGIAPESKVIPIKVLNESGSGFVSSVLSAIRYAADLGAKVINMSLAAVSGSLRSAFESAVSYAMGKGSVVVAAAGNSNTNLKNTYPAAVKDVIAVGATDQNNLKASFSNYGNLLDFVAPGVSVLSTWKGSTYATASGTSMSSPIVAGVVALLRAYYPTWTFTEIYNRLASTATDLGSVGKDSKYGYGLVNAFAALSGTLASSSSDSAAAPDPNSPGKGNLGKPGHASFPWEDGYRPIATPQLPSWRIGNWYTIRALQRDPFRRNSKKKE